MICCSRLLRYSSLARLIDLLVSPWMHAALTPGLAASSPARANVNILTAVFHCVNADSGQTENWAIRKLPKMGIPIEAWVPPGVAMGRILAAAQQESPWLSRGISCWA